MASVAVFAVAFAIESTTEESVELTVLSGEVIVFVTAEVDATDGSAAFSGTSAVSITEAKVEVVCP